MIIETVILTRVKKGVFSLCCVWFLSACSVDSPTPPPINNQPKSSDAMTLHPNINTLKRDQQISFAKENLAEKLRLPVDEIIVISANAVTWRSAAIGCPKPNVRYMQALIPGVLILLQAGGDQYRFHAKTGGEPKFCPNERAESPSNSSSEI